MNIEVSRENIVDALNSEEYDNIVQIFSDVDQEDSVFTADIISQK